MTENQAKNNNKKHDKLTEQNKPMSQYLTIKTFNFCSDCCNFFSTTYLLLSLFKKTTWWLVVDGGGW